MTTPTTVEDGAAGAVAVDAVDPYIAAIAGGDLPGAWDLLNARSQEALGGFEEFRGLETALAEGIGAWSEADDRTTLVNEVGPVDGATALRPDPARDSGQGGPIGARQRVDDGPRRRSERSGLAVRGPLR